MSPSFPNEGVPALSIQSTFPTSGQTIKYNCGRWALSRIQTSDRAHGTARDSRDSRPWREIVCAGLLFWLKRSPTPEKGIQANLGVNAGRAGGPCPSNSCFGGEVLGRPGCAFVESCQGHDLGHARADLRESAKLAAFSASPLPSTASWGQKMLCWLRRAWNGEYMRGAGEGWVECLLRSLK